MIKVSNPFSSVPPLFTDLAKVLLGDIDCSQNTLEKYSNDGSPFSVRPQTVIYPKNTTDIKHVISFAREYSMPITTRGSGTAKTGGALGEGIVIDMKRYFTQIRQVNMMNHTITVDAGVTVKELREQLRGWKMEIPILTAQDNDSTIGALISTKSTTPASFHFGTIREWVEGLTVVVDSGEEHKISDGITPRGRLIGIYQSLFPVLTKFGPALRAAQPESSDDATGYCVWNTSVGPRQLLDQLVGSEGTLGIITSVTFRIAPLRTFTRTVCVSVTNKNEIAHIITTAKESQASQIFMYDGTFMELAERYHLHATPTFPNATYVIVITFFENDKEKISVAVNSFIKKSLVQENAIFCYDDKQFIERIHNPDFIFSLLNSYTQGTHVPITVADGIIVPLDKYASILEDIENYLFTTGKLYTILGNAGSGHISVITLFDPRSSTYENDLDVYTEFIFTLVKKYRGGISGIGGEGLGRTPYVPFIYNEATIVIFNEIKKVWDPLLIFNPGKKIGTTITYLHNHLLKKDVR